MPANHGWYAGTSVPTVSFPGLTRVSALGLQSGVLPAEGVPPPPLASFVLLEHADNSSATGSDDQQRLSHVTLPPAEGGRLSHRPR